MKSIGSICLLIGLNAFGQTRPTLQEVSQKLNKELPENYDHATRLVSTSVENNNFYYHFILKATVEEYQKALPMVQSQIMKTVCSRPREKTLLKDYKANIIYRYESEKGTSLGEFMVRPEHCR